MNRIRGSNTIRSNAKFGNSMKNYKFTMFQRNRTVWSVYWTGSINNDQFIQLSCKDSNVFDFFKSAGNEFQNLGQNFVNYLNSNKICTPWNFAPLIFGASNFRAPWKFRTPLFFARPYSIVNLLIFIHSWLFSSPFNFSDLILRELAPLNFRTG